MVLNSADGDDDLRAATRRIDGAPTPSMRRPWLPLTETLPHTLSSTVLAIEQLVRPRTAARRGSPSDLCVPIAAMQAILSRVHFLRASGRKDTSFFFTLPRRTT